MSEILKPFLQLPRFPDGRIDYTSAQEAPVLVCFVRYKEEYLLLKRSDKVGAYQKYWSTIAGFIDNEQQTLKDKVLEELSEEIGVGEEKISQWRWIEPYEYKDQTTKKIWLRYSVIVDVFQKPEIKLDWEHTEHVWITPEKRNQYLQITGSEESWKRVLSLES